MFLLGGGRIVDDVVVGWERRIVRRLARIRHAIVQDKRRWLGTSIAYW